MSEGARDLLVRGIAAAKAGDREEAARYLEWALRQEPSAEQQIEAWLWLSEVAAGHGEARRWTEEVLAREPHNPRALRRLALLDGRLQAADLIDPDRPSALAISHEKVSGERFACPSCGAPLAYAPDGHGLLCDHCGHRVALRAEALGPDEAAEDFVLAMATARGHSWAQAHPTFTCPACGAHFLLAPAALSLTCPYCDAIYAVEEREERMLVAPRVMIPFRLTAKQARECLETWLGDNAKEDASILEHLTGVYLPFWVFELGGVVEWKAEGASSTWAGEEGQVSGAEPPVSPVVVLACSNPRPGSASAVEGMEPAALTPFDPGYLAAWPAETYSLSMGDAALRARQRALHLTGEKLKRASMRPRLNLKSDRMVVTSGLLGLAPVWLAEVSQGAVKRHLALNGLTGSVHS